MRKISGLLVLTVAVIANSHAQDHKVSKSSGRLEIIEVNDVRIEGYSGNEIVFSSRDGKRDDDGRAKGLRAVSSLGLEDNTGIGLSVIEKGDVVEVRQLKKMDGPDVTIKVPKGVAISYRHTSPHGSELRLKGLENEIEVSTVHNEVMLEDVTGPLHVKTVHGDVDVVLNDGIKNPINVSSVHGHVDVAVPAGAKANLKIATAWGEILIDPQLKIEMEKKSGMVEYSDNFNGKLNGGGTELNLSSTHDNVYVRKK